MATINESARNLRIAKGISLALMIAVAVYADILWRSQRYVPLMPNVSGSLDILKVLLSVFGVYGLIMGFLFPNLAARNTKKRPKQEAISTRCSFGPQREL